MSEHTKGPWTACRDGECSCGQVWSKPADRPVAMIETGEWGDTYWECEDGEAVRREIPYGPALPREQEIANARLIAKAPKMYEALEIIAHNLSPNGSKAQTHNQLSYAIGVAVQAIAKAE